MSPLLLRQVYALKFHDGVLYSGGADGAARSWDVKKGKLLKTFKAHTATVWCVALHGESAYGLLLIPRILRTLAWRERR